MSTANYKSSHPFKFDKSAVGVVTPPPPSRPQQTKQNCESADDASDDGIPGSVESEELVSNAMIMQEIGVLMVQLQSISALVPKHQDMIEGHQLLLVKIEGEISKVNAKVQSHIFEAANQQAKDQNAMMKEVQDGFKALSEKLDRHHSVTNMNIQAIGQVLQGTLSRDELQIMTSGSGVIQLLDELRVTVNKLSSNDVDRELKLEVHKMVISCNDTIKSVRTDVSKILFRTNVTMLLAVQHLFCCNFSKYLEETNYLTRSIHALSVLGSATVGLYYSFSSKK